MKKFPYQVKQISVIERYIKRGKQVFQHWTLPNGEVIERLTPYDDVPWIEANFPVEETPKSG